MNTTTLTSMEQKYNMQNNKRNNARPFNNQLSLEMTTNMLSEMRELLLLDFSDETWSAVSDLVRGLSTCVSPGVYARIGELWAETFAGPRIDFIDSEIKAIIQQVENENAIMVKI